MDAVQKVFSRAVMGNLNIRIGRRKRRGESHTLLVK